MKWNVKVNARGRKIPFVGKSLFQIGKELRPTIDRIILGDSLVPDQAIQDKSSFPWIPAVDARWQKIRNEAVAIQTAKSRRSTTSPSITAGSPPTAAGNRCSSRATATGCIPIATARRSPPP